MEILQELAQAVGFGVLFTVFGHQFQQWLGLLANDGKLENHRRVEHGVGVFLIGKNPFVLASAYGGPSPDSLLRAHSTIFVVANNTPEQSVVGGRDVVVVVKQDGG